MGEPDSGRDTLSVAESNLLLLLDTAGTTLHQRNGSVRWALAAEDVCDLLELAVELLAEWDAKTPLDAWTRAAWLLGATVED
jgi:hypothetical protein